ncbi:PP2C family protein-serine/threonine phosphatase [Pseudovibrio brasiliensis]|uniref:PPM-type phosphatase domain-containing protein n=1 Tax=Pseudovibrio brasiliensis TaxID=1898042 RepID=A0ABX8AWH1_9HYPH|nr:hypothetical protein [Pseudovibrio brasiliensis]QUS59040.1 hypothetical protein KGB56_25840 [Pseudovibrio brasiliensis]
METNLEFNICWRSQKGSKTPANQDYGGAAVLTDTALYIIADGSTYGRDSGKLAQSIVYNLVDWYVETNGEFSFEALIEQLQKAHKSLSKTFPTSSASYAILHLDKTLQSRLIHAGDCLIGRGIETPPIQWQIKPHTLVNALLDAPIDEIAKNGLRNRLTRSFRAKEFIAPSTKLIEAKSNSFILATDGFWAELSEEEQSTFIAGHDIEITSTCDDKSVLCIEILGKVSKERLWHRDNFYLRKQSNCC